MTASESETGGGSTRGKSLAWRSRSGKDIGDSRDGVGSESGRDIGRNIANWWTSAVEQTSTFLMDEVPATFAGLSVGAKELKPAIQRGTSFSSFSLAWKITGEGSKRVDSSPKRQQEDVVVAPEVTPKSEAPPSRVSPRARLERSLERSRSRKQVEKAHETFASSPKPLELRSPHRTAKQIETSLPSPKLLERSPRKTMKHAEKVPQESSLASTPKKLLSSPHRASAKHSEKMPLESSLASTPKQSLSSPHRASAKHSEKMPQESSLASTSKKLLSSPHRASVKNSEKLQEPSASSPKKLQRSPHRSWKHVEKALEPSRTSPKPFKWLPLTNTQRVEPPSANKETPCEPSEPSKHMEKSPLRSGKSSEPAEKAGFPATETPKPIESSPGKASIQAEKAVLPGTDPSTRKTSIPSESSPMITTDPRSSSRLGESRRRTKRMPVDMATSELEASPARPVCLSTVSQEFLLGEGVPPGSGGAHSLEALHRQQFWTPQKARTDSPDKSNPSSSVKRVDGSGLGSSRRSCSSRSLARGLYFDDTVKHLSPQLTAVGTPDSCDRPAQPTNNNNINNKIGVVLPIEEIFPGNTNSLPQIRVRTPRTVETASDVSKNPLIGGSTRVTQLNDIREESQSRLSRSSPVSPRYASGESRTARLLRRLKFTGRGQPGAGSDDSKLGKKSRSSSKPGKAMTDFVPKHPSHLHRDLSERMPPRKLDFSFHNWTDPNLGETERSLARTTHAGNRDPAERSAPRGDNDEPNVPPRVKEQRGRVPSSSETSTGKKNGAWPWNFKWKWGPKSKSRTGRGAEEKPCSVPRELPSTSDQRGDEFASPSADIMSDARETFLSQSDRFSSRGSADKLASDRAPKHRRVLSWGAGTTSSLCSGSDPAMTAFTPSQPRLPTRDAQELLLPPRKLLVPPSVTTLRRSQEHPPSSNPASIVRGSSESDVFEDCFGSFRSTESPTKSFASFRSLESPTVSNTSVRKATGLSVDVDECVGQAASACRQEIELANTEDPCTSAAVLDFKCQNVQQFNKFLRAQKDRLRRGLDAGNTDRFCIVLTGKDLELSSMVAAMSYAWVQENSFPSVSGDTWHPIPMIDIPRQQMNKHKDAAWLFDACGIDARSILFADEIELAVLVGAGRIKMSIIGQDVLVTRNEVGSVCTLLMEMLLAGHRGLLQPRYMKALMLAGILLDTENLDFASMRDTAMSNIIVEGMGCFGRTNFYNRLMEAADDERVSKLITQNYVDSQPSARLKRTEAEHEQSDRDSIFTHSEDHTSTSEAGSNSSLDEDSPRPKLRHRSSFKYSRLPPHSAPAKSHRLSRPGECVDKDAQAVAHIRKAATQSGHPSSALPSCTGPNHRREKSSAFARIRKNLFFVG